MAQAVNNRVSLADVVRVALPIDSKFATEVIVEKRPINWVASLTELDNLSQQVQSGDLVVVPPTLQAKADAPKMRILIESLEKADVSACIFFDPVSSTIIKLADGLNAVRAIHLYAYNIHDTTEMSFSALLRTYPDVEKAFSEF